MDRISRIGSRKWQIWITSMISGRVYAAVMVILAAAVLSGCRKGLPDPQVIHHPMETASPVPSETPSAVTQIVMTDTPLPSPAVTLPPAEAVPDPVRYTVEPLSQDGLFLDGVPTGVGCVPVCIEMMTAWWNSISSQYPILTAQEVIDRNSAQGLYVAGRGMSSASAADELAELGYVHEMKLNSSREELLSAFERYGPVGVLVKTNWVPTTMNHAAVLTGYDPETDSVTLNDPFYGTEVSWTWDAFDGIWGLNYAGDRDYSGSVVRRVFFVIYPEGLRDQAADLPDIPK